MIKNFFTTLFRNFARNKFYTTINVVGLSVGLMCTILILLFVQEELSYDKYNVNHERIVRVGSDFTISGKRDRIATSALPFGPTFVEEFPEVEGYVRFQQSGRQQFKYGEKDFYEDRISYADSSVFTIFSFPLLKGDPQKALTQPYTIVLNETLAEKYFGDEDPIGKILLIGENTPYTVSGVMKNLPTNSHFRFHAFYSMKTLEIIRGEEAFNSQQPLAFWSFSNYTYLLLNKNSNSDDLLEKFPAYYNKYMRTMGDQLGVEYKLIVQKLADIHLRSQLQWDARTGNIKYIYILSVIAIFILSIASINYMNMATARSSKRAKEVGIRKVVGAQRENIIRQFMFESISLTVFALIIALICVELLLPFFNQLVDKDLILSVFKTPEVILFNVILAVILGIISGSYPALYLSSFQPAFILKGQNGARGANGMLRKLLVISQFTVSTIMISGTIVVAAQLVYMNNKDVGFNKENVLVAVVRDSVMRTRMDAFKTELKKNPNVKGVTTSSSMLIFGGSKTVHLYESKEGMQEYALNFNVVDFDYLDVMQMKVIEGRDFNREIIADTASAFIVNQAAVSKFNWLKGPLGKKLQLGVEIEGEDVGEVMLGEVIGVVQDYNYQSLKDAVEPMSLIVTDNADYKRVLYVRINAENRKESIVYIEKMWNEFCPNMSFSYDFLDDQMKENYETEERLTWIFSLFSLISILIASLGLFGLSSFMAEQRTKELGIRKVLGASVNKLVYLLTKEFIRLILIANLISIPISYWALNIWLSDFPYHISISAWMFVVTLIVSLFIGLSTVAWQSYRAATSDPIKAIKYE